ncbi:cell wall-associated hydrolase, invasion-associated protein [Mycolicibacterium phlei]|jgi:cell wall-associated NlpC family hydrolase|uniref:Hydrolase n=1 Tax=Mycolicibacterium phlei DSM 43239 = CCUG 21000 TaxID=1226750 RepID=A0A5N5UVG3_MYCPH|nr:NlpC/P60 family peptidoglycan-binding protein RipD [Mycolicibacterium phlei]VEG09416.1 cell wall-associated hydrolase, invasion-associated protein [Mycobacteroides chelonae]AMO61302.1 Peptidoglycan endopeptidase RipA precursor [Mycolicibacterium phlei]EID14122.1 cell wall-associated hydrolase, invasion-associated protein [Mycolicibacterium phlei RIVM601174]KAB7752459.1 hydrolase [Mycolicibacterium phlei DSM 43239 = CCUG 21000]KXW60807.1 hydrolase [Mycolicibacterium phlei DSM 43239 = CCUG 21
MKRIFALVIGLAVLVAIPGVAAAAPTARSAANQQAIDIVIARGLSQRGVPFSYGGGGPNGPTLGSGSAENVAGLDREGHIVGADPAVNKVGFDASGLMVYSYAGIGVKLPRSSGAQYQVGQKVLPSEALPGDLIFYGPEGTQSVALFLGNGQMLEATEQGVAVSPVRTNNMAPYLVRIVK